MFSWNVATLICSLSKAAYMLNDRVSNSNGDWSAIPKIFTI